MNMYNSPSKMLRLLVRFIAVGGALVLLLLIYCIFSINTPTYASRFLQMPQDPSSNLVNDVFNTTLGFEKVFVISLPSRTDRRDAFVLAAALNNFEVEFVDGVRGGTVEDKALPPGLVRDRFNNGEIGCWRAHANVLQEVIRKNLSSVLILEDDADWDIRLKQLLHGFALSSLALTQPLSHTLSIYADATYPSPKNGSQGQVSDLYFTQLPLTVPPKISPYGDNWDMLWLGHCGMRFPFILQDDAVKVPKGRVIHALDASVPEKDYLKAYTTIDDLKLNYPPHTRAVHHVSQGSCSQAYAVSQAGARRLLHSITIQDPDAQYDLLMSRFCEGTKDKRSHTCLTVQPPLFKQHRAKGRASAMSDIANMGDSFREAGTTENIRWSTRLNLGVLLEGGTEFDDQFPNMLLDVL